jgi:thiol-disulfide isomerase/thioredoxin
MPDLGGRLSPRLASLLNGEGKANLRHPDMAWTVDGVLDDLLALMGRPAVRAGTPPSTAPSPSQARSALKGSAAPLAALHAQGGRLLGGGAGAFKARLAQLRGHPVVVNEWASWCPPCQKEFPLFAQASVRYGTRVAFVGLDVNDDAQGAHEFMAKHPVSYPSYSDDGGKAADALGRSIGLPTTVFLDAHGKVISTHVGEYRDAAQLADDIDVHAFNGRR